MADIIVANLIDELMQTATSAAARAVLEALGTGDLVNDLVTGGTGKALTAEQGKTLKALVDDRLSKAAGGTVSGPAHYAGELTAVGQDLDDPEAVLSSSDLLRYLSYFPWAAARGDVVSLTNSGTASITVSAFGGGANLYCGTAASGHATANYGQNLTHNSIEGGNGVAFQKPWTLSSTFSINASNDTSASTGFRFLVGADNTNRFWDQAAFVSRGIGFEVFRKADGFTYIRLIVHDGTSVVSTVDTLLLSGLLSVNNNFGWRLHNNGAGLVTLHYDYSFQFSKPDSMLTMTPLSINAPGLAALGAINTSYVKAVCVNSTAAPPVAGGVKAYVRSLLFTQ